MRPPAKHAARRHDRDSRRIVPGTFHRFLQCASEKCSPSSHHSRDTSRCPSRGRARAVPPQQSTTVESSARSSPASWARPAPDYAPPLLYAVDPSGWAGANGFEVNGVTQPDTITKPENTASNTPMAHGVAWARADGTILFTFHRKAHHVTLSGMSISPAWTTVTPPPLVTLPPPTSFGQGYQRI